MDKRVLKPEVRFPNFGQAWTFKKFGELTERISNPVNVNEEELYRQIGIKSHGKGIFHKESVTGKSLGNKRVFWVKENVFVVNIVFAWEQAVAKTTNDEIGMIASHRFPMYFPKSTETDLDYLVYFFLTSKGKSLLELASPGGAGRNKTLGQKELEKLKFAIPEKKEQIKISSFLKVVDEKLKCLKNKKRRLEQYKKGVMQKIFSQELRFKDDNGNSYSDWMEKKLSEVVERVTTKNKEKNENVLTISAQFGLISQLEFFNKSVSAKDLSGYYLLHKDDFAYNRSYSNGYPMGAIKRLNRYIKGVVSTLYICFRFKNGMNLSFMEQYFETGLQNTEIEKVAQEGARNHGLLNIGVNDFFNINIMIPSIDEQSKIANFLSALDEKINLVQAQIEKTETWKRGLLQKMFV